jgi:DNA-3-methyladenine glycosylase
MFISPMLDPSFFNRDTQIVAKELLGKVIFRLYQNQWLHAQIIEAEAYYIHEKASHSSLGFTEKRKALFMPPGTIYMYYARGGDSLNVSTQGEGNAVLIKSAIPYKNTPKAEELMQALNPKKNGEVRSIETLCAGQTLLCKSLHIKVPEWNQRIFDPKEFYIKDVGYVPKQIIETTRLGISPVRDAHLPYRFIDTNYIKFCTARPPHSQLAE